MEDEALAAEDVPAALPSSVQSTPQINVKVSSRASDRAVHERQAFSPPTARLGLEDDDTNFARAEVHGVRSQDTLHTLVYRDPSPALERDAHSRRVKMNKAQAGKRTPERHDFSSPRSDERSGTPDNAAPRLQPIKIKHASLSEKRQPSKLPNRSQPRSADARLHRQTAAESQFEKKPSYPALVSFTSVQEGLFAESRPRSSNKTKISRSLFGGTSNGTPSMPGAQSEDNLESFAAIEAIKDLALPPHLNLPGRKMTEQEAAAWLDQWVQSFDMEQSAFSSSGVFAEVKLQEMLEMDSISAIRKGQPQLATGRALKPNGFRTAVCFNLLDRIWPQLGMWAPLVKSIRDEIAQSVYVGLNVEELDRCFDKHSHDLHYAFKAAPYFVDNVHLFEQIQTMKNGYEDAQERMRLAEKETKRLREEVTILEARLAGFALRVQTVESEMVHEREDRHRKESQMLEEMHQLREKVMQGQIAAAQLRATALIHGGSGGGGGRGGESSTPASPVAQIMPAHNHEVPSGSHFVESQMANLALKDTLEYLKKSANDAMSFMEEQVKQCASDVQMWRQASTNAHDITMLLAKAGETIHLLPKMQPKPSNLSSDLKDGVFLMQVLHQTMPSELQPPTEEFSEFIKSPEETRFLWIGRKMCEHTGDSKWMTVDLSSPSSTHRLEMLMLLIVGRPRLDGAVFGQCKLLQNMMTEISERFDQVQECFSDFSTAIETAIMQQEAVEVVSIELLLRNLASCQEEVTKLNKTLPAVADELRTARTVLDKILLKVANYLQERSNTKVSPDSQDKAQVGEERQGADDHERDSAGLESSAPVIPPVKHVNTAVDLVPGKLGALKASLAKPVRHIISNLVMEKLQDMFEGYMYEDRVRILEKCAEICVVHYDLLRRTFRHYCKVFRSHNVSLLQSGGSAMSVESWQLLMQDIKVVGPEVNCPPNMLDTETSESLFARANYVVDHKTGRYAPGKGAAELEVSEFVEGLLRTAAQMAKKLKKESVGRPLKIFYLRDKLWQEVVFTFQAILASIERDAKREESAHFRQSCRMPQIEHLLTKFSSELTFVYKVYAGMDTASAEATVDQSSSLDSLNLMEFMTMMKDAGIQDINLTKPEIMNIFIYVQDDGSIMDALKEDIPAAASHGLHGNRHHGGSISAGQPMADDTEMDYGEFCEALCGCACYKTLDPYITMPQKLEFLLIKNVIPLFRELKAGKMPSLQTDKATPQDHSDGSQAGPGGHAADG